MKKLIKRLVVIALLGMTFLSGSSKELLVKSANAAPRGGGSEVKSHGASCG